MDSMVADVDVVGVRLCDGIGSHEYGSLIVTADQNSSQLVAKLTK